MADGAVVEKKSLSDVMLAMDVVDTLRHRRLLVERELFSDKRDQTLINRLRAIYTSQGIEVTDEALRAGVEALREERFTYQPPRKSLSVRLAHLYINRGKWGLRAAVALGMVAVAWLGYTFFVSGPAERRLQEQVISLNTEISALSERIQMLEQEANKIQASLAGYADDVPLEYGRVAATKLASTKAAVQKADSLIESATQLNQVANIETGNFSVRSEQAGARLREQQALVSRLDRTLTQARAFLADIDSLKIFPGQLAQLKDAALATAREKDASKLAQQHFDSGMAALRGGQITEAESALTQLRALNSQLLQSYSLLVVSREGEQSGVWRVPERNPNARNYYLVVEAVGNDGTPLSMTITNEEDGRRVQTRKWGLRVSERVYQRIRSDKLDDGIIQGRRVGEKRRGYLTPEYLIRTSGDAITEW